MCVIGFISLGVEIGGGRSAHMSADKCKWICEILSLSLGFSSAEKRIDFL